MITARMAIGLFVLVLMTIMPTDAVRAQSDSQNFTLANELLREGRYEEAYEIFNRLLAAHPRSYAVFDRTVTSLTHLKRYDEAIALTRERIARSPSEVNTQSRLGDIYYMAGRNNEAMEVWNRIIDRFPGNANAYQRVAEAMNQHRLYRDAIEIYEQAREELGDPSLFAFEIANNYLSMADFEAAMMEYLEILGQDESMQIRIQRQLLNYDEQQLYDMAILITEERLEELRTASATDLIYRDFLVWLNMESGRYRRALAAAHTLERYSNNERHTLFRIGMQLRSRQEFELAGEAFSHYLDLEQHPLQPQSYEELSRTYQDWAGYLIDHNLDFGGAADSLYRKAFETINRLTTRYPRYDRIIETLMIQAELALDHLKDPEQAREYHDRMSRAGQSDADQARTDFIEGRVLLFKGRFSMARVAFTRSNRLAGRGEIADKSRYYLGLGDFYNGDFSFSQMQLRSLERVNTSYYANNALQLRYMIQEAYDEEGENMPLHRYASARYRYDTGHHITAAEELLPILDEPWYTDLYSESLLLLSRILRTFHPGVAFRVIDRQAGHPSMQQRAGERLLWERARLAEAAYIMQQQATGSTRPGGNLLPISPSDDVPLPLEELLEEYLSEPVLLNHTTVAGYYEELLKRYPFGYYADLSRRRIRALEAQGQQPRES